MKELICDSCNIDKLNVGALDVNYPVLNTENVARGGKLSFQNVGGAKVYNVLTFQKSRGGKSSPSPPALLNETMIVKLSN